MFILIVKSGTLDCCQEVSGGAMRSRNVKDRSSTKKPKKCMYIGLLVLGTVIVVALPALIYIRSTTQVPSRLSFENVLSADNHKQTKSGTNGSRNGRRKKVWEDHTIDTSDVLHCQTILTHGR